MKNTWRHDTVRMQTIRPPPSFHSGCSVHTHMPNLLHLAPPSTILCHSFLVMPFIPIPVICPHSPFTPVRNSSTLSHFLWYALQYPWWIISLSIYHIHISDTLIDNSHHQTGIYPHHNPRYILSIHTTPYHIRIYHPLHSPLFIPAFPPIIITQTPPIRPCMLNNSLTPNLLRPLHSSPLYALSCTSQKHFYLLSYTMKNNTLPAL